MSERRELKGGSSEVSSDWLTSGEDIGSCEPINIEGATSVFIVGGWLVVSKVREGGSSGEAGLGGVCEQGAIGDKNVTSELVRRSKPEGVRGRESSSGSEMTERQSSQGGKIECNWA